MPKTATTTTSAPSVADASLFDVTEFTSRTVDEGVIERVPLEAIDLADNPRKQMSPDGIERLAGMLMRTGQLVPCIGRRVEERVLMYVGQRRFIAAKASHGLAGTDGYEHLKPLASLIVLLLDHEPTADEIRRIQAQENAREDLTRRDQQEQFRDCWQARAGLADDERIAAVCDDLGISPKLAHSLRRELTLPEQIRARVSPTPTGDQLSVGMAARLADMHEIAPALAEAIASRITTRELHDTALRDQAGFVHRTVVEDEHVYAVRIDAGALLDAHEQIEHARQHLDGAQQEQVAALLTRNAQDNARDHGADENAIATAKVDVDRLDVALDGLSKAVKAAALKIRVDSFLRERASNGNFAYTVKRGQDFADGIWVVDPVFLLGEIIDRAGGEHAAPARDEAFFAGAKLNDDDMKQAVDEHRERQDAARERAREGYQANQGLGMDIRAGLMEPKDQQLQALKTIVCHLLIDRYRDVIAFGAGWTDQERQQPVGDTSRLEPRQPAAIADAELQRALDDPDPLRGIAQLVARFGAAFVLDPGGVTRTKALGRERMERKLREALPGGDSPLRQAVWQFMRPMLSPYLVQMNHDAFVSDDGIESSVDLDAHRRASSLDALDLGDEELAEAA